MHSILDVQRDGVFEGVVAAVEARQERTAEAIPFRLLAFDGWHELMFVSYKHHVRAVDRIGQQDCCGGLGGLSHLVREDEERVGANELRALHVGGEENVVPPLCDGVLDVPVDRLFLRVCSKRSFRLSVEGVLGSDRVEDAGALPESTQLVVAGSGVGDAVQEVVSGSVGWACCDDYLLVVDDFCPGVDDRRRQLCFAGTWWSPHEHKAVVSREYHRACLLRIEAGHCCCPPEVVFGWRFDVLERPHPRIRPRSAVFVVDEVADPCVRQRVLPGSHCGLL